MFVHVISDANKCGAERDSGGRAEHESRGNGRHAAGAATHLAHAQQPHHCAARLLLRRRQADCHADAGAGGKWSPSEALGRARH